jgi:hypothetical protein
MVSYTHLWVWQSSAVRGLNGRSDQAAKAQITPVSVAIGDQVDRHD